MNIARLASFAHKWLALVVGVQVVFWVASGLFFTLVPIEQVRSEHLIRHAPHKSIDTGALASFAMVRSADGHAPTKLTIEQRSSGPVVIAEFADAPPSLFDARSMARLSPIDADSARQIARRHVTLQTTPASPTLVVEETPEYRGALPAWRARFPERGLAVYVAQNTGAVTARRSDLWRVYDTLWGLHIMDWRGHENFNHPLIVLTATAALLTVIAGLVLLPFRLRPRSVRR
jgi:hypothetical protein